MIRFFLVTIKGRKYVTDGFTLVSTGIYQIDLSSYNIHFDYFSAEGVAGFVKASLPVLADPVYTYYYNTITKILTVRIDIADFATVLNNPDFYPKTFLVHFIICLTDSIDLYWNIDPDSPNTRMVLFESRLMKSPTFSQSQENNLNGVLSFSSSSLEINNQDREMNRFFGEDYSLKGGDIFVWRCEETTSDRRLVYKGTVSKIDIDDTLRIASEDFLNKLDSVLYSNGSFQDSIVSGRNEDTVKSEDQDRIHRVYGRSSSFKYKPVIATTRRDVFLLDKDYLPKAHCIDLNNSFSTTVNRTWDTGYMEDISGTESTYTIATVSPITDGFFNYILAVSVTGDFDDFSIGDTCEINGNYFQVVGPPPIGGSSGFFFLYPYSAAPAVGNTIKMNKVSALVLTENGNDHYLKYIQDYTVNAYVAGEPVGITLVNNFEATHGIAALDPNTMNIFYKLRNTAGLSTYSHANQVKKLLLTEFVEDDLNLTSFADADSALDLDLCYMVPDLSGSFPNKRDILQKLLSSSFGYIYLDENFKIAYGNFKIPTPTESLTDTEILKSSIDHSIDFKDIYYSVYFSSSDFSESFTLQSGQALYLHNTNLEKEIPHYCDVVSFVKPTAHFKKITKILTMKRIISQMSLLETPIRIGDEKIIDSEKKLGDTDSVVLSLDETGKESIVRLAQMENAKGGIRLIYNGISQGNI